MEKFPFDDLIDFLVAFVKKLLDSFDGLKDWAGEFLSEEE